MPGVPHPQGRIVELGSFPSRFEADVIIAMLASNGIRATADYGDGDGWAPHLARYQGARVLVFDDDLETARDLLESTSPLDEPTDN
jgi:putative signal transducing protein